METKFNFLPSKKEIQDHSVLSLSQFWKNNKNLIENLPIKRKVISIDPGTPLKLSSVLLPDWAKHHGVNNCLLVPSECLPSNYGGNIADLWREIDWFLAIFLMIECWHERLWENKFGPIHSYSFRLKGWDERAWERAWVNRIGLFLREWVAFNIGESSEIIFGKQGEGKINMTHDVDAVEKTWAIRFKQSAFILFNALRALYNGKYYVAFKKIKNFFVFFFTNEDWFIFDKLLSYEKNAKIQSTFHFYSDLNKKNYKKILIDPSYKINSKKLRKLLANIRSNNHKIGLHPGFETWNSVDDLYKQKKNLEEISGISISNVRQHWLRFSWNSTWDCQQSVGLKLDTTLMFNDRPGFRNSSSLVWSPWNIKKNKAYDIKAMPSILMDSHFYDYMDLDDGERVHLMDYWIKECQGVSGESSILWHPHTLTNDYGWSHGFFEILSKIKQ